MDPDLSARLDRIEKMLAKLLRQDAATHEVGNDDGATLKVLWENTPSKSRQRTTKRKVWEAWKKIPKGDRPDAQTVLDALKAWKRCDQWVQENGMYIPGLHILVRDRFWESPPEDDRIIGFGNPTKPTTPPEPRQGELEMKEAANFLADLLKDAQ